MISHKDYINISHEYYDGWSDHTYRDKLISNNGVPQQTRSWLSILIARGGGGYLLKNLAKEMFLS